MKHNKYCMMFDMGHTVDGNEFDNFDDAKYSAIETLIAWMAEECYFWNYDENHVPCPNEKQIEDWDKMIHECCVYVVEWDEEAGDWEDIDDAWFPSYEVENEIGWMEWDELKKKNGW